KKETMPDIDHLILVPGHAIYTGGTLDSLDSWILEPYQRSEADISSYVEHVRQALSLATELNSNRRAGLVVFSGGATRRLEKTEQPLTEARSYLDIARSLDIPEFADEVNRIVLEEHARDSFENVLFGICRFREATGRYPQKIAVVGFSFKRRRFVELHRQALAIPCNAFTYIGSESPTFVVDEGIRKAEAATAERFSKHPFGAGDESLEAKRYARNPYNQHHNYRSTCPELASVLD
ncbi:hypothetical protein GQ42DRAFT_115957, partial [Ramicandelaber brevisporus]